ncbi:MULTISPECIES: (2Fe-2S)-binding protein [Mesotoga]|uniref:Aerobic-type carbon monoxide dehydrogenase, small subunit CoxS/CutS-like protein n=1 Tax=Mesotoga prima MesG1.Ag.4.2 TaxID=660470 RepID=I2F3Y8_9BACT|nr:MULTISPECIES: (2Fe-2S)-binding protein [Mesotoga]AFK06641.1 aerobic-type carbon monoxide dehydrogenase, small subunit CoxS/CutS-like protein [Mesotoga prima MesG1.Ag.4.2]MCB1223015.1 (2Fe-2S)-binding protein [Mesotoga sp.]PIJ62417.1 (2Fe-2S)-binding protein [Mesotoga sp. H07.pep.5.3]RLL86821.1 (2Fe-2S)-binding protein [Mesotoga sp. H07pep.5.4]HPE53673.1 (2Fe-2S)-binding protein [Mesotoga prima]
MKISFTLNNERLSMDVVEDMRLLDFLRDELGLTGTKEGCGEGECGACTVIIDGKAVNSCLVLLPEIDGSEVTTIEGLSKDGELDTIQKAFVDEGAVQCGFCTPGMIMSAKALLDRNDSPSDEEIMEAIEGNLCRCTGYYKIVQAIKTAAENLRKTNGK